MNISLEQVQHLLDEIERLRRENAMLRRAAGINVTPDDSDEPMEVSTQERKALLRKTI